MAEPRTVERTKSEFETDLAIMGIDPNTLSAIEEVNKEAYQKSWGRVERYLGPWPGVAQPVFLLFSIFFIFIYILPFWRLWIGGGYSAYPMLYELWEHVIAALILSIAALWQSFIQKKWNKLRQKLADDPTYEPVSADLYKVDLSKMLGLRKKT